MYEIYQSDEFKRWRNSLEDKLTRAIIATRLDRLSIGLEGDSKSVGDGIRELRIHFGSGFRIYFTKIEDKIVLLLCAGNKSSQNKDISLAKEIAKNWSSS